MKTLEASSSYTNRRTISNISQSGRPQTTIRLQTATARPQTARPQTAVSTIGRHDASYVVAVIEGRGDSHLFYIFF